MRNHNNKIRIPYKYFIFNIVLIPRSSSLAIELASTIRTPTIEYFELKQRNSQHIKSIERRIVSTREQIQNLAAKIVLFYLSNSMVISPSVSSRMPYYKHLMLRHAVARHSRYTVCARVGTGRIFPRQPITIRTTSSASSIVVNKEDLLDEAARLTKSLYRNCIRSVRLIRWGNAFDEKDFEKREEEFQNPTAGGVISMAPPPNKEDELHSRAEYYYSYTREYFTQESDCLDNDPLEERDIRRYLYYLRKGDKDRKWLLGDMMFPDPYKNSLDKDRISRFEAMSKKFFGEEEEEENNNNGAIASSSSNSDGFIEDEDPDWFQKVSKKDTKCPFYLLTLNESKNRIFFCFTVSYVEKVTAQYVR